MKWLFVVGMVVSVLLVSWFGLPEALRAQDFGFRLNRRDNAMKFCTWSPLNRTVIFNKSGTLRIFSWDDPLGYMVRFSISGTSLIFRLGNMTMFSTRGTSRISSWDDPLGYMVRFSVSGTSSIFRLGNMTMFSTRGTSRISSWDDPLGYMVRFSTWDTVWDFED